MDDTDLKFNLYNDSGDLQRRLESIIGNIGEGTAILFSNNGRISSASVNKFTIHDSVQIGCIAKSLTATLVAIAQYENKLRLEDSVIYFFDDFPITRSVLEHLSTTKIYHLLNHTHGLDHSLREALPKGRNGYIDVNTLLTAMNGVDLLAPPGLLSLYSSIGSWFVAAILECVYGQPYINLLNEKLFAPIGINALDVNLNICPAVGGDLRLSASDMMKIIKLHLHGNPDLPGLLDYLVILRTQYPSRALKWPPVVANFYPGWIDFDGSYGQLGFGEDSAGTVRFIPEHDAAIVVTASHQKLANYILAALFKDVLRDFGSISSPHLLSAEQWAEIDSSVYQGIYENGKYRMVVNSASNGSLNAQVFLKQPGLKISTSDPYIKRLYQPAANHTFISIQPEQSVCPLLQFSHPQENGLFKYLNTGKFVFTRIACAASRARVSEGR
jgi:CubicO group peptidase (beta-lactamase class C family)